MNSYEEEIEGLRREINRLNAEIVEKLAERVEIALRIGEVKRRHGRPIVDMSRESKVYQHVQELAQGKGIDSEGVVRVFREIIRLCTEAELEGEG
jgi:chorismate mutase